MDNPPDPHPAPIRAISFPVRNGKDASIDWASIDWSLIQRIVIGRLPPFPESQEMDLNNQADWENTSLESFLKNTDHEWSKLSSLTHLHLWNILNLKSLSGPLPQHLKCLDLRGCCHVETLPALPPSLEVLDVGYCTKLRFLPKEAPHSLTHFYFGDCEDLNRKSLEDFLESAQKQRIPLTEIDATRCPAVDELKYWPITPALRKVVLQGCEKLTNVDQLGLLRAPLGPAHGSASDATFVPPVLSHLDLAGCKELESLPWLPDTLQFLCLQGCTSLLRCCNGLSVSPAMRGESTLADLKPRQQLKTKINMAEQFKLIGKAVETAPMATAKLLLLGDGRVGKTTLAKTLMWYDKRDLERMSGKFTAIDPRNAHDFTRTVKFWNWDTSFKVSDGNDNALIDLKVHIWDFGGQELYHNTHRVFAREGSVYLVVFTPEPPPIGKSPDRNISEEEWKAWNSHHSIDYWLDYIDSIRPKNSKPQIALVCTHVHNVVRKDWNPLCWRNASPRARALDVFHLGLGDESIEGPVRQKHGELLRLYAWIEDRCAKEAQAMGLRKTAIFKAVCENLLLEQWTQNARTNEPRKDRVIRLRKHWTSDLEGLRKRLHLSQELSANDVSALTEWLHRAGYLVQARNGHEWAVFPDPRASVELVYSLTHFRSELYGLVKQSGGWFRGDQLKLVPSLKELSEDRLQFLLAFMEKCDLIIRLRTSNRQVNAILDDVNDSVFFALDRPFLSSMDKEHRARAEQVSTRLESERVGGAHLVSLCPTVYGPTQHVKAHDFQRIYAKAAYYYANTDSVFFENGFQVQDGIKNEWCLRVDWKPKDNKFWGVLEAKLWVPPDQKARISETVNRRMFSVLETDYREDSEHSQPDADDSPYAVLLSSGANREEAEKIYKMVTNRGLPLKWYDAKDDSPEWHLFYHELKEARAIIMLMSKDYLTWNGSDKRPLELASAINSLHKTRSADQTIIVCMEEPGFSVDNGLYDMTSDLLMEAIRSTRNKPLQNQEKTLTGNLVDTHRSPEQNMLLLADCGPALGGLGEFNKRCLTGSHPIVTNTALDEFNDAVLIQRLNKALYGSFDR